MVRVISVSDEVYGLLVKIKGQKMSFSEAIKQATSKSKQDKNAIMDLFGVWKGRVDVKKWKSELYAEREKQWSD